MRGVKQPFFAKHVVLLALLGLAGCASSGLESAYQLIEQQQSQQALMRQHEADEWRKNAPNQREMALNAISDAQRQGRYFASLAFIDAYVAEFGSSSEVEVMQAEAYRHTGQPEKSQQLYQRLASGSEKALAYRGLGLLAGQQHRFAQAADYLSQAVQYRPTDALLLSDLGFAQLRSHQLAAARVSLGKAAELEPENNKVLSNLSLYLLLDNQPARAEQLMDRLGMNESVRTAIYSLADEIQRTPVVALPATEGELADVYAASTTDGSQQSTVVRNLSNPSAVYTSAPTTQHVNEPVKQEYGVAQHTSPAPFGFANSRLIQ